MGAMDDSVPADDDYYTFEADGKIFTKETLMEIRQYQKTVELIGIVDQVEIRSNVIKFTLVNKDDDIIQFLIWDESIKFEIKNKIVPGYTLHIDGAFAKPRNSLLSNGNTKFDLTIMSNTVVRVIEKTPNFVATNINAEIPIVSFEDAPMSSGKIKIIGYIKNTISKVILPNGITMNQGCISDCEKYKLEVRMPDVDDLSLFKCGTHVSIIGTIKFSQHPYIWVTDKSDINVHSENVENISKVLKGSSILKKPSMENMNGGNIKRFKKEK